MTFHFDLNVHQVALRDDLLAMVMSWLERHPHRLNQIEAAMACHEALAGVVAPMSREARIVVVQAILNSLADIANRPDDEARSGGQQQ